MTPINKVILEALIEHKQDIAKEIIAQQANNLINNAKSEEEAINILKSDSFQKLDVLMKLKDLVVLPHPTKAQIFKDQKVPYVKPEPKYKKGDGKEGVISGFVDELTEEEKRIRVSSQKLSYKVKIYCAAHGIEFKTMRAGSITLNVYPLWIIEKCYHEILEELNTF